MSTNTTDQAGPDATAELRTVNDLHRARTGKVSNKWSSYLGCYDQLFGALKDAPLKLFEIGIQNGGSLETWGSYFQNAESIIGCDIDENCRSLTYADPRISVIVGNANTQPIFQTIVLQGPFAVVGTLPS